MPTPTDSRILRARRHAGLTQIDLAYIIGVNKETIGNWELGKTGRISNAYWKALERATGVPVWWLRGEGSEDSIPSLGHIVALPRHVQRLLRGWSGAARLLLEQAYRAGHDDGRSSTLRNAKDGESAAEAAEEAEGHGPDEGRDHGTGG